METIEQQVRVKEIGEALEPLFAVLIAGRMIARDQAFARHNPMHKIEPLDKHLERAGLSTYGGAGVR